MLSQLIRPYKKFMSRFDLQLQELLHGSLKAMILKTAGAVLVFAVNAYIARTLGVDKAGIYFLAFTIMTIAMNVGRLGLDNAVVRFVASHASTGNWPAVKGVFRTSLLLTFIGTFTFSVLIFFTAPYLSEVVFNKPTLTVHLKVMTFLILPTAFVILLGEAQKGLKRIGNAMVLEGVLIPFFVLTGLLVSGYSSGINGIIYTYIVAVNATMLVGVVLWRYATPQLATIKPVYQTRELLASCSPLLLVAIMNLLMMWTSTIVLGIYRDNAEVGIYNIATRTAHLTNFMLVSINSIAAPKFAELYHNRQFDKLSDAAKSITQLMIVVTMPVVLMFILFPSKIMSLFGDKFGEGGVVLTILAIGYFVNVATGSVGYLLMMSANEKMLRNNIVVVAAINTVLNFLLVPNYGMTGAAVATMISMILLNLISLVMVRVKLGFWTTPFPGMKR